MSWKTFSLLSIILDIISFVKLFFHIFPNCYVNSFHRLTGAERFRQWDLPN